jgi:ketosteroid isomerase-like protein
MAEHPNASVVRQLHGAFSKGDLDGALATFTDDAVWHTAGKSPLSGEARGKDQIRALFMKLMELSEGTFRAELHDVTASDEHAVYLGRDKGQRAGKSLDEPDSVVCHIRDGKISEAWQSAINQDSWDDFWA